MDGFGLDAVAVAGDEGDRDWRQFATVSDLALRRGQLGEGGGGGFLEVGWWSWG